MDVYDTSNYSTKHSELDSNTEVLNLTPMALPSGNKPAKCGTGKRLSYELSARKIIPLQAGN